MQDPYYEEIPHPRNPKKTKKVKKHIPAYIPDHDAEILARARKRAYKLDFSLFNFLGFRFGWSSVIGLIPFAGDFFDWFLAFRLMKLMEKIDGGLPQKTINRMRFNLLLDAAIGLIPFIGDLADAYVKCNGKNVRLLEEYLDKKYKPKDMPDYDEAEHEMLKKEHKQLRRARPATVYDDYDDEDMDRLRAIDDERHEVRQPQRAYSGRRERLADEEMGIPRNDTHRSHNDRPSRNTTKKSTRR